MKKVILILIAFLGFTGNIQAGSWFTEVESGLAISGYNAVKIPGDTGTRFSLNGDFDIDPGIFYRIRIGRTITERDELILLIAPLSLKASGTLEKDIFFNGTNFPAGAKANAKYRFDSYRLSWLRTFKKSDLWLLKAGFTAKIRDAAIRLEGNGISSEKTNTGFVPLLGFSAEYLPNSKVSFLVAGDALAAPQGRAEDILLAVKHKLKDNLSWHAGYRFVEGGADNDEVYNFTLVNYATIGISFNWQ